MKPIFKTIAVFFCLLSCCILAVGCGGSQNTHALKSGETLSGVVARVEEHVGGITMGKDVEASDLENMFGISSEDVEEYAGKFSIVMNSSDNLLAVKAKEGRADAVEAALKARQQTVIQNFETYLPEQLAKAKAGQVLRKGDYVFLVIVGQNADNPNAPVEESIQIIEDAFEK